MDKAPRGRLPFIMQEAWPTPSRRHAGLKLSAKDAARVVEALADPPAPNKAARRAAAISLKSLGRAAN